MLSLSLSLSIPISTRAADVEVGEKARPDQAIEVKEEDDEVRQQATSLQQPHSSYRRSAQAARAFSRLPPSAHLATIPMPV